MGLRLVWFERRGVHSLFGKVAPPAEASISGERPLPWRSESVSFGSGSCVQDALRLAARCVLIRKPDGPKTILVFVSESWRGAVTWRLPSRVADGADGGREPPS